MLAIEVQFLDGRYVATAHDDRRRAEWPPHPARLFSAMVAALHDREPVDGAERAALLKLERAGAPAIEVSNVDVHDAVGRRTVHDVYVPVNDVTVLGGLHENKRLERAFAKAITSDINPSGEGIKAALSLLPSGRRRQRRSFAAFTPDVGTVRFCWSDFPLDEANRRSFAALLDRVTRLGHSSSLVRCALAEHATPTLVPAADDEPADWTLRVVAEGQLARLEAAYERHRAVEPRALPSLPARYRIAVAAPLAAHSTVFGDDWIVFAAERGPRFQASRCVDIAKALRRALMRFAEQPPPELITGHEPDGEPSSRPHLAIVSLPDVGHEHAHGGVLGVALVLPKQIAADEERALLRSLARLERAADDEAEPPVVSVALRTGGTIRIRRGDAPSASGLRSSLWCRPSRRWATATPIALDRNPGNLRSSSAGAAAAAAKAILADSCERIGLPRPATVEVSLSPVVVGADSVRAFNPFPPEPGKLRRVRVHAELIFEQPVRGPLLIGAGRYIGLGLCRPLD